MPSLEARIQRLEGTETAGFVPDAVPVEKIHCFIEWALSHSDNWPQLSLEQQREHLKAESHKGTTQEEIWRDEFRNDALQWIDDRIQGKPVPDPMDTIVTAINEAWGI